MCRMESSNTWLRGNMYGVVGGGGGGTRKRKNTVGRPKVRIGTLLSFLAESTKISDGFVTGDNTKNWLGESRS